MKKTILNFVALSVVAVMAMTLSAVWAQKPAQPENLQADVVGHKVTLSWQNADAGTSLLNTGFEGEDPFAGWTIDSTNRHDSIYTWFAFPDPRFLPEEGEETGESGNYKDYIYKGEKSAMVYYDADFLVEHDMHQDEWLISPELDGAAYLTFHYFIDPMILQYGAVEEFPDHYAVVVSKDGGETWSDPIWDARYDASADYGWAMAVLALDAAPTDKMKIAFRAYGVPQEDEMTGEPVNEGLYFVWAIDEVTLTASRPVADEAALAGKKVPAGQTYREYVAPRSVSPRVAKRANPHAKMPIVNSYKILLDDEVLAENVMSGMYVDKSEKTAGKHVYKVVAVSGGAESDPASKEVELAEMVFAQPKNVELEAVKDEETGEYEIFLTWEAPDGDFQPVYYNIYCDGDQVGWEITDFEFSQWGYTAGLYEFGVEAVYQTPDGVSEQVIRQIALEVRFGVTDLKAEVEGEDVVLTWTAPREDGHTMGTYTVYRAADKVADNLKETTFRDQAVPAGFYQYTVIAVYEDQVESVRTAVDVQVGKSQSVTLPYEQKFATTFCPKDLRLVNLSEITPDKYGWYFDDGSRLGVEGEGFDGCYAAVDCSDAGMYPIDAALELPAINLTNVTEKADIVLSFNYSYATSDEDMAGVEWSLDGEEWYVLMELEAYDPMEVEDGDFQIRKVEYALGEVEEEELTAIEAGETLYFRFHYTATESYHFAVDNILLTGPVADTTGPGTAVEGLEEAGVTVSAAYGQVQVRAASPIRHVEVYAMNGLKLAERDGNGGTEMSLPVAGRGPVLVRVTTDQGMRVVKMLL